MSSLPSTIASRSLWHTTYIKVDEKIIPNSSFSVKGLNFVGLLFQNNSQLKTWNKNNTQFNLT